MLAALLLEVLDARAGETLTVTTADELSVTAALEGGLDVVFGRGVAALSVRDLGNGVYDCSGDDAGDAAEDTLALSCTRLRTLAELVICATSGVCDAIDEGAIASDAVDEVGSVTWTVVVSNSARDVSLTGNSRDWVDAKLTCSHINGGDKELGIICSDNGWARGVFGIWQRVSFALRLWPAQDGRAYTCTSLAQR
jgi:hypothetical protein